VVFRTVLGVGETDAVTATETDGSTTNAPAVTSATRPELAAAHQTSAAADRQVRAAQAGFIPRLNAFASYDLDSGNGTHYADSWLAGVSVDLNIFDGFLTRGKVAEARANLASAREQERKVALAVALETRQAQLNLEETQARLATTGKSVEQAAESVQITKDRYANGLALLTQLLDAENALTAARQRRAAVGTDLLIARAALDHALGQTWKDQ
ncbi:MAG: TolC family protein, partial [Verrucomicrobiota bacterium]